MAVTGISHIAVGVSDMERALAFYRDIVGLDVHVDHLEDVRVDNVAPYQRRAVYMSWGDRTHRMFLVLDSQEGASAPAPKDFSQRGIHHFAFAVDNLDAIHDRAAAAGVPVVVSPVTMEAGNILNPLDISVRTTFLKDPDGNIIQLDQYL